MTRALNIRPESSDSLAVTAAFVKTNFLFGVNLQDDNGNIMPDSLIEFYIKSAQRWLERELDIYLFPTTIENESHDYYIDDYYNFSFIKLYRKPVIEVTKVNLQFPVSSNEVEFNSEWFRCESVAGQVNLIPTEGTLSQIFISAGGNFLPILYMARDYIPHVFRIDYKVGFEAGKIPEDILEVIGMRASMGPLNIAGDLIAGAGIASKSLSLDGLSQSIGTTSSATNAGYGARIIQYDKHIKDKLSSLKAYYRGLQMVVA